MHVVDATFETDQHWFCLLDKQGHLALIVKPITVRNVANNEGYWKR